VRYGLRHRAWESNWTTVNKKEKKKEKEKKKPGRGVFFWYERKKRKKEKNIHPLSGGVFFVPKTNVPGFRP
jgi:hypothetical protein